MSKVEKTKLTKRLTIRMDEALYEKICNGARTARVSQVEYARHLLKNGKVTVKQEIIAEVPELKRLIAEFGKIGSNLNQIAHHFNAGGAHSSYMYEQTMKALAALYSILLIIRQNHPFCNAFLRLEGI